MDNNKKIKEFPGGFFWGAATSSHQIEGGNINDWSEWEESGPRLAELEKRGWKREDYVSGKACNSYENFEADLECIKKLNLNAYRFSLEWSRIEPEEGKWNVEAIARYKEMIKKLRADGIEPFVTTWHWSNPIWLKNKGGWTNEKVAFYFERFTDYVAKELGSEVKYWVTLNEPLMHIAHGYLTGKFPPNHKKDLVGSIKVFFNLVAAHKKAQAAIKKYFPEAQVGVAMTNGYFEAAHKHNPLEVFLAWSGHYFRNLLFMKLIVRHCDYVGVNYYHHDRMVWYPPFRKNLNEKISDFGWEIFPEGIYHVLMAYKDLGKPIFILENGVADREDKLRKDFIADHLSYVHKAIQDGAPVRGYFHWSLLDNFEWADGYHMKFGLCTVDRETFRRELRPSARYYSNICKNNALGAD